ncbi:metallophosphoesterase family protein [Salisediminibacterium selenitireducens]|uniref:Nuclease SbcCD subunit D n=1 Tax=Bacillus selenitireducens (strain ATCC 700615 / DSM 15326 / MLS10) TaxID=439292 RepID=D6XUK0_BACIE|nr:exonuclease SbcCD subunit D C-terminal domain-containing protein [Salisediminibacterium selenitireducens]ADH99486.1 nuclease SbcCD, D subunit [[Bacillus] selenitireducens MLS10]
MRVLHTADWHFGRTIEGRDRHDEHEAFIDELCGIVHEEEIDVVLIAGDIYDSVNPPAKSERLFYDSLSRLSDFGKRTVVAISGNHDHPERLSAASAMLERHSVYIQGQPTLHPLTVDIKAADQTLCVPWLPYPSESRLKEVLAEEADDKVIRDAYNQKIRWMFGELTKNLSKDHVNIAMSHVFAAGGNGSDSERPIEVGGSYTIASDSFPSNVDYTALGHLHRPQTLKHTIRPARYAGSPLAFSFGERGVAKSVTVLDITPGHEPDIREIPISSGKQLLRWEAVNGFDEVFHWMNERRDFGAWIDLKVHLEQAPSAETIAKIKEHYPGILIIQPVFPDMQSPETRRAELSIRELFDMFYKKQMGGAEPDDRLRSLFIELVEEDPTDETH